MMNKTMNLIEFEQVTKIYKGSNNGNKALDSLNFKIKEGEHVAIVGKSGCGKSTLLNMLTGIDHPTEGVVTINGSRIHSLNETELASFRGKNIGIVFQFFQLIPTLTIFENILLAMDFVDVIKKKDRQDRATELLRMTGISDHKDKLPSSLSGGEQQRAAIARALANDPPMIVADEPTGNLDSKTTQDILDLFRMLSKLGKTIIIVTHESFDDNYDRVITLKDGKILDDRNYNQSTNNA